jgi:hypothetical protein
MSTEQPNIRALWREWTIGIIVVIGGFVIAIAVAAWLTFGHKPPPVPVETPAAGQGASVGQQANQNDPTQVCRTALANAKSFGIIPSFGQLTDANPRETEQQGRYVCEAATPAAKYTIAVDLVCQQLSDAKCVNIYSIAQGDGSVLYQRQQ